MTPTELADRLEALAESLIGDDWEHPLTAVVDCRAAAKMLREFDAVKRDIEDMAAWAAQSVRILCNAPSALGYRLAITELKRRAAERAAQPVPVDPLADDAVYGVVREAVTGGNEAQEQKE